MSAALCARDCEVTVSVVSDYGSALLPQSGEITVLVGPMSKEEMLFAMVRGGYGCIIDATHPYAVEATENITWAAKSSGLALFRLLRDAGDTGGDIITAENARQGAQLCMAIDGGILLTIGSKELEFFAAPTLRERCFPRVLPEHSSLSRCLELGFPRGNILCMQGPFSKELNLALIRQYNISAVVTKFSGAAGGFFEKLDAANETGCKLIAIERPAFEKGNTFSEIMDAVDKLILSQGETR